MDFGTLHAFAEIWIPDRRGGDQVHWRAEELLQRFLEAEKGVGVGAGRHRLEFDQEIEIAVLGVEILARRRAEKVEPPYVELSAQFPQFLAVRRNVGNHRTLHARNQV